MACWGYVVISPTLCCREWHLRTMRWVQRSCWSYDRPKGIYSIGVELVHSMESEQGPGHKGKGTKIGDGRPRTVPEIWYKLQCVWFDQELQRNLHGNVQHCYRALFSLVYAEWSLALLQTIAAVVVVSCKLQSGNSSFTSWCVPLHSLLGMNIQALPALCCPQAFSPPQHRIIYLNPCHIFGMWLSSICTTLPSQRNVLAVTVSLTVPVPEHCWFGLTAELLKPHGIHVWPPLSCFV